ncbi:MAG TPA: hypothetical protein PLN53_08325 [Terricaulis sp.]|nr:hypothetical protein [Terricaulis sp.]
MVEKTGTKSLGDAVAALKQNLTEAEALLRNGETQEAERCAKAVSALVKAARDVADLEVLARAQPPEKDEEALRAEIMGRLRRLAAARDSGAPDDVLAAIASGAAQP